MGDEFYCSIKLVTGEEIFSLISIDENDEDPIIILQNPVIIKIIKNNYGLMVKIKPWLEIPSDDFFIIKPDKVVTMTEVTDPLVISFYTKYISNNNDTQNNDSVEVLNDNKVKISKKMGYVCSVEEARKKLEMLYKTVKDGEGNS
jgi:hypothetical protein